jgi:hypothetical protein
VFALSVAKAQQAKNGMAAGGIAGIAQTMKNQGRGKDTMLAHISPEEAELLEKRGGVGTINPATGLPEYGIFDDIGNALSGVGNAVGSVLKPVGDLIGSVVSSPLAMAATAAAAYYFMGPSAGAVIPSVAEAALPMSEVAAMQVPGHLTPAAIEAGMGSPGYGFNASAAASGLFNPETIGSGAAIGAPSTTDKLLSANLLKNVKLSSGEEEPASDPNALIKMLMMFEMMNNKQSQPVNSVVPALAENTSTLPYDTPKKQMSSFVSQPSQTTQHAAGGGLMTKHLGIGGLSARRSQTDYAKNYLPGSGYRPGQGGITYFTPMEYTGGETTSTEEDSTSSSSATDELLRQTLGRTGGGMDSESRAAMLADTAKRMDAWEKEDPEGYKKRNDWIGDLFNGSLIVQLAKLAAQGIDKVKQTWANNRLEALGINPNIVLANQNQLAGLSMQQALNSLGQASAAVGNYAEVGGYTPGTPEAQAAASGVLGDTYGPGTAQFTADREAAADKARIDALIASLPDAQQVRPSDMGALPLFKQDNPDTDTWGGGINANQGVRTALNPFPGIVDRAINNQTQNVGDYTPGQFQGAYLPEGLTTAPIAIQPKTDDTSSAWAQMDAETAALKAEQAQQRAAEEKQLERYTLQRELQKSVNLVNADPNALEGDSGLALADKMATLKDQLNKLDSPYGDRFSPESPMKKFVAEDAANAINNLEPGDRFAPVDYSNQYLQKTPDDVEKERQDQIVQSFLNTDFNDVFGPASLLAAGDGFNLGDSSTIGNYSLGSDQNTKDASKYTLGSLDSSGMLQTFPGAINQVDLPGLTSAPTYSSSGSGLAGLSGSFGGLGSAWQGVVDRYGNPVLTSQGAAERAFLSSPEGIAAANEKAYQNYSPPQDPAQRQGQGNNRDGGDGGDGGNAASNAAAQIQANDNSATSGGWFSAPTLAPTSSADGDAGADGADGADGGDGDGGGWGGWGGGGGDARGGYLQHGKFDQRMAHGGIAALHQYNLGSYSDGGRLLKGPGDGVSDSIPATIGQGQPARLADGEFVIPARIVSELGNGSTDAGARKLYAMMDRIQRVRRKTKNVAANTKAAKYLPA